MSSPNDNVSLTVEKRQNKAYNYSLWALQFTWFVRANSTEPLRSGIWWTFNATQSACSNTVESNCYSTIHTPLFPIKSCAWLLSFTHQSHNYLTRNAYMMANDVRVLIAYHNACDNSRAVIMWVICIFVKVSATEGVHEEYPCFSWILSLAVRSLPCVPWFHCIAYRRV